LHKSDAIYGNPRARVLHHAGRYRVAHQSWRQVAKGPPANCQVTRGPAEASAKAPPVAATVGRCCLITPYPHTPARRFCTQQAWVAWHLVMQKCHMCSATAGEAVSTTWGAALQASSLNVAQVRARHPGPRNHVPGSRLRLAQRAAGQRVPAHLRSRSSAATRASIDVKTAGPPPWVPGMQSAEPHAWCPASCQIGKAAAQNAAHSLQPWHSHWRRAF
jgi:hypothetical protein